LFNTCMPHVHLTSSDKGARRYGPQNSCCAVSPKSDRLSSDAVLGIVSSFLRKPTNTKVADNFVTIWTPNLHYLESGRGRYCAGKEGVRIRKIWTRMILWKPSSLLSQGRSRTRQGGERPKAPKGVNTAPWVPKEG
jgi:hypothetical protein